MLSPDAEPVPSAGWDAKPRCGATNRALPSTKWWNYLFAAELMFGRPRPQLEPSHSAETTILINKIS
jgi:hypothetical protein